MKELRRKTLITSIMALLVVITLAIGTVWAWFFSLPDPLSTFVSNTGDIKATFALYAGNDITLDGTLDPISYTANTVTRTEHLGNYYNEVADIVTTPNDKLNSWLELSEKRYATFKLLTIVDPTNEVDGMFGVSFSAMGNYFFSNPQNYYDVQGSDADMLSPLGLYIKSLPTDGTMGSLSTAIARTSFLNYLGSNCARLLFKLKVNAVRKYARSDDGDAFTSGYANYTHSSIATEQGNDVEAIALSKTEYFFHEISYDEPFVNDIPAQAGELIEVDFVITRLEKSELQNYLDWVATNVTYLTGLANKYVAPIASPYRTLLTQAQLNAFDTISRNFITELSDIEVEYLLDILPATYVKKQTFTIRRINAFVKTIIKV
ncbi:MAG: hypothetical protein LBE09_06005 [Christensenellaceae bacterium]|nr:hypothetical protein [Christensenellaceae bacterium]